MPRGHYVWRRTDRRTVGGAAAAAGAVCAAVSVRDRPSIYPLLSMEQLAGAGVGVGVGVGAIGGGVGSKRRCAGLRRVGQLAIAAAATPATT